MSPPIVRVVTAATPLVVVSQKGPRGPAGGQAVTRVAAQALGGHRVVRALASGEVDYASADTPAHAEFIVGITAGAASAAAIATVRTGGELAELSWTWTPGPIFCGVNGVLTQTVPTSGFIRQVAVAETATRILIDLRPPIVL